MGLEALGRRGLLGGAVAILIAAHAGAAPAADLKVGANIGNVPWEFQDASGNFVGFEIDLVNEVGKRLGKTVEVVNIPFQGHQGTGWDEGHGCGRGRRLDRRHLGHRAPGRAWLRGHPPLRRPGPTILGQQAGGSDGDISGIPALIEYTADKPPFAMGRALTIIG